MQDGQSDRDGESSPVGYAARTLSMNTREFTNPFRYAQRTLLWMIFALCLIR